MTPVALPAWGPRERVAARRFPHASEVPSTAPAHLGLWLDRYMPPVLPVEWRPQNDQQDNQPDNQADPHPEREALYNAATSEETARTLRESYEPFFKSWRQTLAVPTAGFHRKLFTLTTSSRLLLHPASNESVTEGSLLLHHTYGVPYIPGSAFKGAVRSRLEQIVTAENDSDQGRELRKVIDLLLGKLPSGEGKQDGNAAGLDFLDALWDPSQPPSAAPYNPLALDIVNPHHPNYYAPQGGTRAEPTDLDEPTPIHRLTVAPRVQFLGAIEMSGESSDKLEPWWDWLFEKVLAKVGEEDGLGAATSVGYGRFSIQSSSPQAPAEEQVEDTSQDRVKVLAVCPGAPKDVAIEVESGEALSLPWSTFEELSSFTWSGTKKKKLKNGMALEAVFTEDGSELESLHLPEPTSNH